MGLPSDDNQSEPNYAKKSYKPFYLQKRKRRQKWVILVAFGIKKRAAPPLIITEKDVGFVASNGQIEPDIDASKCAETSKSRRPCDHTHKLF